MEIQWCPLQSMHCIMYVIILYENSIFLCPQKNKKPALSKTPALGPDHFQKLATLVPRKAVNLWKEGKEGKILHLQKSFYLSMCGQVLVELSSSSR